MANTFELISSVTVGSGGAASIDFTSIPATYTDLVVKVSGRTNGDSYFSISFNGVSTNLSGKLLYGNGSSAGSVNIAPMSYVNWTSTTSNTFGNAEIYIPNYAGSAAKSLSVDGLYENNATAAESTLLAGLWNSTAAINAVKLSVATGTFVQYSTAYLYGVKNA